MANTCFKSKKVATSLEYSNSTQTLRVYVDTERTLTLKTLRQLYQMPKRTIINMLCCIYIYIDQLTVFMCIHSKVRKTSSLGYIWVLSAVLPSIGKRGAYVTKDMAMDQWHAHQDNQDGAIRLNRISTW